MSNHYKDLVNKYEHALDTMYKLFKFGRDREKSMEAKLNQIKQICEQTTHCSGTISPIRPSSNRIEDILVLLKDDSNGVGL